MKRFLIALAGVAAALAGPMAFAQMQYTTPPPQPERRLEAPKEAPAQASAPAVATKVVDAPKPQCEDPGAYPGRVGMQTEDRRNKFIKSIEAYKTCMMNFVEERKATIKANETAARSAIDEFNARMKRYTDEQEKAKD
jgi:hypothetical protein